MRNLVRVQVGLKNAICLALAARKKLVVRHPVVDGDRYTTWDLNLNVGSLSIVWLSTLSGEMS